MSTAQVANSGIVGSSARIPLSRHSVSSPSEYVDSLGGAYAPPPRDQWHRFEDENDGFDSNPRRRGHHGRFQDNVVSFGGVLVSREVGTTIMQAQAAQGATLLPPVAAEAERGIAIYEFNQALIGVARASTTVGYTAQPR